MLIPPAYRPRRGPVGARYGDLDVNQQQSSGVGLGIAPWQTGNDPNLNFTLREEAAQRERAKLDAQLAQEQMRQAGETGRNADKLVAGNVEQQNDLQFKGWNAHQQRLSDFSQRMADYGFRGQQSALERAQAEKMAVLSDELQRGRMGLANEFEQSGREAQYDQQEYMARLGNEFDQGNRAAQYGQQEYMARLGNEFDLDKMGRTQAFQTERDRAEEQRRRDFFDYQSQRYEAKDEEKRLQQEYMAQLGHANKLIESGRATRPPGWDAQMLRWQASLGDLDERADLSPEQKSQARKDLQGKMSRAMLNIVPQAPGQWGKPMEEAVQEQVYWDGGEWGKGTPWVRDAKSGQPVIPRGWKPDSQAGAKQPTRKDILDHAVKLWNTFDSTVDGEGMERKVRVFKTIGDAVRQAEIDYEMGGQQDSEPGQQGGLDPAIIDAAGQARQLPVESSGQISPYPRQVGAQGVSIPSPVAESAAIDQEQSLQFADDERPSDDVLSRMGAAFDRRPATAVDESGVFQQHQEARRPAATSVADQNEFTGGFSPGPQERMRMAEEANRQEAARQQRPAAVVTAEFVLQDLFSRYPDKSKMPPSELAKARAAKRILSQFGGQSP